LRVSLVTSCADEGTPAQGEAVAPPFESFSRKVLAQARDALESPASPAAALRRVSSGDSAFAIAPDDRAQSKLLIFCADFADNTSECSFGT
jgi:hypothetical protein